MTMEFNRTHNDIIIAAITSHIPRVIGNDEYVLKTTSHSFSSAQNLSVKSMNNHELASLLRHIAALQDEQGVAFKPAAYRKAF